MSSEIPQFNQPIRRLFMTRSDISLSRLLPIDALWLEPWFNDQPTTRYMAIGRTQVAPEALAHQIMAWGEPANWPFAILKNDQVSVDHQFEAIGYVGLFDMDVLTRKAEFRILIGKPWCGKGYGTEATKLMLAFGFGRLGLQRIWLGVTDANVAAKKCYLKCGFSNEGTLRRDLYRDGRWYDSIRMSILHEEYERLGGDTCLTEEEKQPETSGLGPDTLPPAGAPWTGFSGPAAG